ncbi:MAG: J domain-containing protein, partial [Burkholderiaceae bacterium]
MGDAHDVPIDDDRAPDPTPATSPASESGHRLVRIDDAASARPLSKAQRSFNRWVERIDEQRRRLADWQAFAETWQTRVAGEYEPLWRRVVEQRIALLVLFDRAYGGGELTRREQARLADVIVEIARDLLDDEGDGGDTLDGGDMGDTRDSGGSGAAASMAEVLALHDRYADEPYAEWRAGAKVPPIDGTGQAADEPAETAEAAEDWASKDWSDPQVWREAGRARQKANAHLPGDDGEGEEGRPRSARAQARLDRRRASAEGATRSVRDAYRKLASALHPDREPDPVERERKTGLMQRVNRAYEAKDLLRLLSLQIEVEQIDATTLAGVAEERLTHYNRVLKEQSAELEAEIAGIAASFVARDAADRRQAATPAVLLGELQQDLAALRRESQHLVDDLAAFKDVRVVKGW